MAIRCTHCSRWLTPDEEGSPCPRCGSLERVTFAQDQAIVDEKAQVARELANTHFQAEAGLQRVFRLTGSAEVEVRPAEPIKLLEVNANTVAGGVLPIQFGPSPASGVPYPSVIVEVTPDEFLKIETHELKLPRNWQLGEELPKPADELGAA